MNNSPCWPPLVGPYDPMLSNPSSSAMRPCSPLLLQDSSLFLPTVLGSPRVSLAPPGLGVWACVRVCARAFFIFSCVRVPTVNILFWEDYLCSPALVLFSASQGRSSILSVMFQYYTVNPAAHRGSLGRTSIRT